MVGQTNINTCRLLERNEQNINAKSLNKIVCKFDAKRYRYRILFKTYLHFKDLKTASYELLTNLNSKINYRRTNGHEH